MRKVFEIIFITIILSTICLPVFAFDWNTLLPTDGNATAIMTHGGPVKAAVTVSWKVATYKDFNFYLDGITCNSEYGAAISTDLYPIGEYLQFNKWLYTALPIESLVKKLKVGTVVIGNGNKTINDCGVIVEMNVASYSF